MSRAEVRCRWLAARSRSACSRLAGTRCSSFAASICSGVARPLPAHEASRAATRGSSTSGRVQTEVRSLGSGVSQVEARTHGQRGPGRAAPPARATGRRSSTATPSEGGQSSPLGSPSAGCGSGPTRNPGRAPGAPLRGARSGESGRSAENRSRSRENEIQVLTSGNAGESGGGGAGDENRTRVLSLGS